MIILDTEVSQRSDFEWCFQPYLYCGVKSLCLVSPYLSKYSHSPKYCQYGLLLVLFEFIPFPFSSVAQSCPTFCDPMNRSMLGLPVHHQLPEFTQTHVHQVSDAIQPSHHLSSAAPPAPNPSQHQSLFQWVNSSHEVAKVLEFQL